MFKTSHSKLGRAQQRSRKKPIWLAVHCSGSFVNLCGYFAEDIRNPSLKSRIAIYLACERQRCCGDESTCGRQAVPCLLMLGGDCTDGVIAHEGNFGWEEQNSYLSTQRAVSALQSQGTCARLFRHNRCAN